MGNLSGSCLNYLSLKGSEVACYLNNLSELDDFSLDKFSCIKMVLDFSFNREWRSNCIGRTGTESWAEAHDSRVY